MKNWLKPENLVHTLALALAVTAICMITFFLHGCATNGVCAQYMRPMNGDLVVQYRCS